MKLRGLFVLIMAAAVLVFMTGAVHTGTGGEYREILEDSNVSLLVFDADGSASNIVTAGLSPCYTRINGSGDTESGFSLPNSPIAAAIRGGSLYTYSPVRGRILMNEIDLNDGSTVNSFYIKIAPDKLNFISGDAFGTTYYVKKDEPAAVYRCGSDGISSLWIQADSDILYCGVTDDTLIYACGNEIFRTPVYGEPAPAAIPSDYVPAQFFSADDMVDVNGVFCRLSSAAEAVYTSGVPGQYGISNVQNAILHAKDENGCFYTGSAEPSVLKTDGSGSLSETYKTKAGIIGVNANGLLINDEGSVQFAPYSSFTMAAEPTPTPDIPDFPEDIRISGGYLLVNEGKTVHELGTQLSAELYLNGNPVSTGVCVTGMTLNYEATDYTVALLGDVNGTGTVNSADLKLIQSYLVGSGSLEDPYLFAADYSENGSVGTEDLARIAQIID